MRVAVREATVGRDALIAEAALLKPERLGGEANSRSGAPSKLDIRALFPADSIYISLLPYSVQGLIGQVGPDTKGVEKMLRRIGFEYAERIDPFDGGPHFIAKTDDITLVKATRNARVVALPAGEDAGARCYGPRLGRARSRAALRRRRLALPPRRHRRRLARRRP